MQRFLEQCRKKVIFATTTPVRYDNPDTDNKLIDEYNNAVVPVLKEMGIIINDLNLLVKQDIEKYILESDKIHLTEEGIEACARQVADIIRKTAEEI